LINLYPLFIISIWITIIFLASSLAKKYLPEQKELSRKIVHIGTGPIIIIAWSLQISKLLSVVTASLITIGLIINYRFRVFGAIEDIKRKSFGTIAYGLSITIILLLFWPENYAAACFGVLAMAFGDGFAGLIGRNVKSPEWLILKQTKSIAGTFSMGLILLILIISIGSIVNIPIKPIQIILLTLLGILLEQIGPWGIDNLTVPIGLSYGWIYLMG